MLCAGRVPAQAALSWPLLVGRGVQGCCGVGEERFPGWRGSTEPGDLGKEVGWRGAFVEVEVLPFVGLFGLGSAKEPKSWRCGDSWLGWEIVGVRSSNSNKVIFCIQRQHEAVPGSSGVSQTNRQHLQAAGATFQFLPLNTA